MSVVELTEGTYNRILQGVSGTYIHTDWAIKDEKGAFVDNIKPGGYIVIENNYTQVILRVNEDMSLTECVAVRD
jgi:hypothetical protein